MKRRSFLSTTGVAGLAGLAGCSDLSVLNDDESEQVTEFDDPESVVDELYNRLVESQTARTALSHSEVVDEAEMFELLAIETTVVEEDLSQEAFEERVNLDGSTVAAIVEGAETAILDSTIEFTDGGERDTEEITWALATENGTWRLVQEVGGGGSEGSSQETAAPTVSFSFDYNQAEAIVTITHNAGDSVQADQLFVRGDRLKSGYQGPWHEIEGSQYAPDDEIQAGDTLDVGVQGDDYEIRILWESPGGGDSSILAESEGPDA